jgi:hypothetical protein
VAEFVECNQDAEGDQKPPYGTDNLAHLTVLHWLTGGRFVTKCGNLPQSRLRPPP